MSQPALPPALAAVLRRVFARVLVLSSGEDPAWEDCARDFLEGRSALRPFQALESATQFLDALSERIDAEDPLLLKAEARTALVGALCALETEKKRGRRTYSEDALELFDANLKLAQDALAKVERLDLEHEIHEGATAKILNTLLRGAELLGADNPRVFLRVKEIDRIRRCLGRKADPADVEAALEWASLARRRVMLLNTLRDVETGRAAKARPALAGYAPVLRWDRERKELTLRLEEKKRRRGGTKP